MTVLIVASPVPSHPSTKLVDEAVASLRHLKSRSPLPVVISNDGVRPGSSGLTRWRYGRYLDRLRTKYGHRPGYTVLSAHEWRHLGGVIEDGLRAVATEYVLVLQHDFYFTREVDLDRLVRIVAEDDRLKHIRFNKVPNWPVEWDAIGKGFFEAGLYGASASDQLELCRTLAWSDNPHLCRSDYYEKVVFPVTGGTLNYPEEKIKPLVSADAHDRFGTFVLGSLGEEPYVSYRDGRRYGTLENFAPIRRFRAAVRLRTRIRQQLGSRRT